MCIFDNDDGWFDDIAAGANYDLAYGKYDKSLDVISDTEFPNDSTRIMNRRENGREDSD